MNNKQKHVKTTVVCLALAGLLITGVVFALPNVTAFALQKEIDVQKSTPENVIEVPVGESIVSYGRFDLTNAQGETPAQEKQRISSERAEQSSDSYEVWKNNKQEQAPQPLGEEQQEIASFAKAEFEKLFGLNPATQGYLLHLRHTINGQVDGSTLDFWMAQWEPSDFDARLLDTQNSTPFETYSYAFYTDSRLIYFANMNHYLGDGSPGLYNSFEDGDPTYAALWKRKEKGESSLTAEEKQLIAAYEVSERAARKKHEALYSENQQIALDFVKKAGFTVQEVAYVGGYSGGTADWGTEVVMKLDSGETITVCVSDIMRQVSQFKFGENA